MLNRKIKFRGKRQDNGRWVEGFLMDESHIGNLEEYHAVDPVTIGQYTGFHDADGREIWEGDIVATTSARECIGRVRWIQEDGNGEEGYRTGFYIDWTYRLYVEILAHWSCKDFFQVVGNTYDTPGLLDLVAPADIRRVARDYNAERKRLG